MSHSRATQGWQPYIDQILIAVLLMWAGHILFKSRPTISITLKTQSYQNTSLYSIYAALKPQLSYIFVAKSYLNSNQG